RKALRNVDLVGRWGGEEFLIVLPETDSAGAVTVATRICEEVRALGPFFDGPKQVTISIGVGTHRIGQDGEQLVASADAALYRAKERGRDRVEVAER
ncbi:MAG: GGDEF domain-containing protein, partial [Myxococcota bacterium]